MPEKIQIVSVFFAAIVFPQSQRESKAAGGLQLQACPQLRAEPWPLKVWPWIQ